MTLGDFIWAALNLPHLRAYGIAHGAVMCLCFGLVIGWRTGRMAAGALAGPIIGVVAALVFYALAGPLRYVALLPGWMTFWILFAFLQHWISRSWPSPVSGPVARPGITSTSAHGSWPFCRASWCSLNDEL